MTSNYYNDYFAQFKGRFDKMKAFMKIVDNYLKSEELDNDEIVEELKKFNDAFVASIKMTNAELNALGFDIR